MTRKARVAVLLTLSGLGGFVPTALAQHGPGRHSVDSPPAYDTTTETTVNGIVADVNDGGAGRLGWLMRAHTLGLGHGGAKDTLLLVNSDTGRVQVHLGPTGFLRDWKVDIEKGDRLTVTGARSTFGGSDIVLAREVRKGDSVWTLRNAAGEPLWSTSQTEPRRFWTTTKVLLIVVAAKVALVATVLSH